VAEGEDLAGVAEEDLLVRDVTAHAHRVDAHSGDVSTSCAGERAVGGIG